MANGFGIALGGAAQQISDISRRQISERAVGLQERQLDFQIKSQQRQQVIDTSSQLIQGLVDRKKAFQGTGQEFNERVRGSIEGSAQMLQTLTQNARSAGLDVPDLMQQLVMGLENTQTAGEAATAEGIAKAQTTTAERSALTDLGFTQEQADQLVGLEDTIGGVDFGSSLGGKARSIVLDLQNQISRGEPLTPDQERSFNLARSELERPRVVGSTDTGFFEVRGRLDADGNLTNEIRPLSDPRRTPERAGRQAGAQTAVENVRSVVSELIGVDASGAPVVNKKLLTQMSTNLPFSRGRLLRGQLADSIQTKLRLETGATANETELAGIMDRFLPGLLDSDEEVIDKMRRLDRFFGLALGAMGAEQIDAVVPGLSPFIPEMGSASTEGGGLRLEDLSPEDLRGLSDEELMRLAE